MLCVRQITMNGRLLTAFFSLGILILQVGLHAQDNAEPRHSCFQLHPDREIPISLSQNRIGPDRYQCNFTFRKEWAGKQVFAKIPGTEFPYILRINSFSFGSDPGSGETAEFNITPFLTNDDNSMELELEHPDPEAVINIYPLCGDGSLLIREGIHIRDLVITSYFESGTTESLIRFHLYFKSYLTGKNNSRDIRLHVSDPGGNQVINVSTKLISPPSFGQETEMIIDETVEKPMLWSPANPQLYRLEVNMSEEEGGDSEIITTNFGIRIAVMTDSVLVMNGDTLHPVIAGEDLSNSLPRLNETEILKLAEERLFNAVITSGPLPCNLVKLFDRTGLLVIRKREPEGSAVIQPTINSPSVVWTD